MRRFSGLIIALFALSFISIANHPVVGQTSGPSPKATAATNPVPATPQSIAAGKTLYNKYCRFCHGDDAKGNGPQAPEGTHPSDLTDAKWEFGSTDVELFADIKDGIGPKFDMKGYSKKMTPQDMWNLVNYLRSLGPKSRSH